MFKSVIGIPISVSRTRTRTGRIKLYVDASRLHIQKHNKRSVKFSKKNKQRAHRSTERGIYTVYLLLCIGKTAESREKTKCRLCV